MKKIMFFAAAIMFLAACSNVKGDGKNANNGTVEKDSVSDSVTFREGKQDITAQVKIVFPVGNEALEKSVKEFIKESVGANDSVDLKDVRAMAHYYVETKSKKLKGEAEYEGTDSVGPALYSSLEIGIMYENDQIITMSVKENIYLGGPHGAYTEKGVTFNKADGKVIGMNILAQDKLGDVKKAVNDELVNVFKSIMGKDYKEAESMLKDENGKEKLAELPNSGLFIQNDSVVFIYQQYEVGPYYFGTPTVKISLKDMKEKGLLETEFAKSVKE